MKPTSNSQLDKFDLCMFVLLGALYVFVAMLPFAPNKFGDVVFHEEAKILASALRGAELWASVKVTVAPGPVLYYTIPYLAVSPGSSDSRYWLAGFAWSVAWMMVSIFLIRRAAAMSFGASAGKVAAILTLCLPLSVYYTYAISAEPPAYLGVTLIIYWWARWRTSGEKPFTFKLLLVGLGLLFFLYCRPNAVLLLPIGLLAALLMRSNQREAKFSLYVILLVSIVFVSSLIGLAKLSQGSQSSYFAHVLFHGRFQYRTEPWDWRFWDDSARQGSVDYALWNREYERIKRQHEQTGIPMSQLKREWALNDALHHPGLTLQMAAVRTLSMHVARVNSIKPEQFRIGPLRGSWAYFVFQILVNATFFLILGGVICFLFMRRNNIFAYWVFWGPWVALLVFHALVYAEPRYLFPSQPGLVIMASAVLAPVIGQIKDIPWLSRITRLILTKEPLRG